MDAELKDKWLNLRRRLWTATAPWRIELDALDSDILLSVHDYYCDKYGTPISLHRQLCYRDGFRSTPLDLYAAATIVRMFAPVHVLLAAQGYHGS